MDLIQEKVKTSLIPSYSSLAQVQRLSTPVYPNLQNIGYPSSVPYFLNFHLLEKEKSSIVVPVMQPIS
jgi:hypothetical protein